LNAPADPKWNVPAVFILPEFQMLIPGNDVSSDSYLICSN
jgi:hypothetical protein